ncbi:MAG: hypothetical protein GX297_00095 [Treponema sp.]|jgi:hypothetical protein|nr:hypothetical protein [Treponema sp.]
MIKEKELYLKAKKGLSEIENAIIELLKIHPNGLTNTEIANILGLSSIHEGGQKDYLTYSVLGNLMDRSVIIKDRSGNRPKYLLTIIVNK